MAFAAMFQAFAVQSLAQLVIRDVAQEKQDVGVYFSNVAIISLLISVALILVMDVSAAALQYPGSTLRGIIIMGISILPATIARTTEALLKAIDRMEYVALGSLGWTAVVAFLGLFLAGQGAGLEAVFWVFVAGELLLAAVYLVIANRLFGRIRFRPSLEFSRGLFGSVGVFFFISLLSRALRRLDVIMLSKLTDAAAVGFYTAAFKLVELFIAFRPAFVQAMFPSMARASERAWNDSAWITEKAAKFFFVVLVAVALVLSISAEEIVLTLYTPEYAPSVRVLQVLVWSLPAYYALGIVNGAMIAHHHERGVVGIAAVSLVLNLVLNWLLIPSQGPLGAAVAMLVSTAVGMIQSLVYIWTRLGRMDLMRAFIKPSFAAAVAGGLAFLLRNQNAYLAGVLACGTYLILVVVTRTFSREELAVMKRLGGGLRQGERGS
jgi:O-antigen/teichoic acid export membrane protein